MIGSIPVWVERRAYKQGVTAGAEGKPQNSNPYRRYPISLEWEMGWFDGYDSTTASEVIFFPPY